MHWYLLCCLYLILGSFFVSAPPAEAAIRTYSDTISDSAPGEESNHTITFTTTTAIPPGGYVRFRPSPGDFTIPATNFDVDNVALYVATSSGFQLRSAASSPSVTDDGVSIITGTSGQIEITLNSSVGIPAGAQVKMLIGSSTPNSTSTDAGVTNPSATTSYPIYIETGGLDDQSVHTLVAIIENITVGPGDTTETIPPYRFNGAPSGELSGTTQSVQMSLETDEFARCRYSTASGTPFTSMSANFDGTAYGVVHTKDVAVATSTSYTFYVRCIDDEGNYNIDDYIISFSVPDYPEGTPGSSGTEEGQGTGSGSGTGSGGSGSGSTSGNDSTSGGGGSGGGSGGGTGSDSGGSSNGTGGSGGFEGSDAPYQSGDGTIIVNGYAFPNSTVVVLIDGVKAKQDTTNSTGSFSITLSNIARGVYTIGVYGIDRDAIKSTTFATTFSIIGSRVSTLSNVNIMPSIVVSPDPVDPGQPLTMHGYSIPNALITIENQQDKSSITLKNFTTTSGNDGKWTIPIDTNGFNAGTWKVRAKAAQQSGLKISTEWSNYTFYGVGQTAAAPRTADLNRDGRVNLIDFSILLFWWNTDGGTSDPPADINADGRVSLTDFSIMVYNWTG